MTAHWHELLVYAADSLPVLLLAELTRRLGFVIFGQPVGPLVVMGRVSHGAVAKLP